MSFARRKADSALTSVVVVPKRTRSMQAADPAGSRPRRSVSFLGCRIDDVTLDEAVLMSRDAILKRRRLQHNDVNVAKFIASKRDPAFGRFIRDSDLICADGMGIVWGCWLMGTPVRERASGCDLMMRLIGLCAREGYRPYFLGARQNILEEAIARARLDHPGLDVAGWRHGYFERRDEADIVAEIRASQADCLFVGMSSPIQDRFLSQYRDVLNVPVQVGVGGSFDVLAGRVSRAPSFMQKCGLEWFFRFAQEPSRLWRRYLITNTAFAFVMAAALVDRFRQYFWPWRKQGI